MVLVSASKVYKTAYPHHPLHLKLSKSKKTRQRVSGRPQAFLFHHHHTQYSLNKLTHSSPQQCHSIPVKTRVKYKHDDSSTSTVLTTDQREHFEQSIVQFECRVEILYVQYISSAFSSSSSSFFVVVYISIWNSTEEVGNTTQTKPKKIKSTT